MSTGIRSCDEKSRSLEWQYLLEPTIAKALGNIAGQHVLELGCTDDYWLKKCKELGAASCCGVRHANNHGWKTRNRHFIHGDMAVMTADITNQFDWHKKKGPIAVGPIGFDTILVEQTVAKLQDAEQVVGLFNNVQRSLATDGRLIFGLIHPFLLWHKEPALNIRRPEVEHYFDEGSTFHVKNHGPGWRDYVSTFERYAHWSLDSIDDSLHVAGLRLSNIHERPTMYKESVYPSQLDCYRIAPYALVVEARRQL